MIPARPSPSLPAAAGQFIAAVLRLQPRIAVFDCDGTLWAGDSGEQFLYWEIARDILPEAVVRWIGPRYRDYKAGNVSEEDICGEMVTIHDGLRVADLERAGAEFFAEKFAAAIFPVMLELTRRLRIAGCELWAVSSTNEWVVRAGAEHFGIPGARVLAASVFCQDGIATGRLRQVPTGPDKAAAIRHAVPGTVDAAFGNSIHDAAMLTLSAHAFAIDPTPELRQIAEARGWTIYLPTGH